MPFLKKYLLGFENEDGWSLDPAECVVSCPRIAAERRAYVPRAVPINHIHCSDSQTPCLQLQSAPNAPTHDNFKVTCDLIIPDKLPVPVPSPERH